MNTRNESIFKSLPKFYIEFFKSEYDFITNKLLVLLLLPGGLICWNYFSRIRFLPELDIQSILLLLSGATIIGLLLFLSIPYFSVFPGAAWKFITNQDKLIEVFFERKTSTVEKIIAVALNVDLIEVKKILYFIFTLYGNFFFFLSLSYSNALAMIAVSVILFSISTYLFVATYTSSKNLKAPNIPTIILGIYASIKIWFYSLYTFSAYIILWLLTTFTLLDQEKIYNQNFNNIENKWILAAIFLLFMIISIYTITDKSKYLIDSYLISIVLFFAIIVIFNRIDIISDLVMRIYGWGNISDATLLVDYTGCKAFESIGITSENKCESKESVYKYNEISILSSIGKNYYLQFPRYCLQGTLDPIKVTLSNTHVISWSRQNIDLKLPIDIHKHERDKSNYCGVKK